MSSRTGKVEREGMGGLFQTAAGVGIWILAGENIRRSSGDTQGVLQQERDHQDHKWL